MLPSIALPSIVLFSIHTLLSHFTSVRSARWHESTAVDSTSIRVRTENESLYGTSRDCDELSSTRELLLRKSSEKLSLYEIVLGLEQLYGMLLHHSGYARLDRRLKRNLEFQFPLQATLLRGCYTFLRNNTLKKNLSTHLFRRSPWTLRKETIGVRIAQREHPCVGAVGHYAPKESR